MGHFISSGVLGGRDVGLSLDLSFGDEGSVFLKLSGFFFVCFFFFFFFGGGWGGVGGGLVV